MQGYPQKQRQKQKLFKLEKTKMGTELNAIRLAKLCLLCSALRFPDGKDL